MNITDEMVERAARKVAMRLNYNLEDVTEIAQELTAALGDVEPLEDVLGGRWTQITVVAGPVAFIEYESGEGMTFTIHRTHGHGPTIDAAIRAAVANAKGGEG